MTGAEQRVGKHACGWSLIQVGAVPPKINTVVIYVVTVVRRLDPRPLAEPVIRIHNRGSHAFARQHRKWMLIVRGEDQLSSYAGCDLTEHVTEQILEHAGIQFIDGDENVRIVLDANVEGQEHGDANDAFRFVAERERCSAT